MYEGEQGERERCRQRRPGGSPRPPDARVVVAPEATPRGVIIAAHQGNEGLYHHLIGAYRRRVAALRGQRVKHLECGIHASLQHADEGDVRRQRGQIRGIRVAGCDDRFGRRRMTDDLVKTGLQRLIPEALGQGRKQFRGAGLRQKRQW